MYGTRVKWRNTEKGVVPPTHIGVVSVEKGAFGSPSTTVTNFTYIYITLVMEDVTGHNNMYILCLNRQ